jgi:tetratricopeptide (TPR) repeat protein
MIRTGCNDWFVWQRNELVTTNGEVAHAITAVRTLPHDTPTFTGRHRELSRLLDGSVGIIAIDGMAGVGKTTLAVHAAHRVASRFPDGQLFLDLHAHTAGQSPVSPAVALHTLLCFTGVEPTAVPAGLDERAALWRSRVANRRVLVVLDNVVGHEQVRPLLPGAPGCCVVITGRRRLAALDGAVMLPLDTLPPEDAAALFVRVGGTGDLDTPDVRKLVALAGYLPLAIRLLGGWLRGHPSWSVADLVDELATAKDRSATIRAENVVVGAAFDMSVDALRARLRAFFVSLGLHPGTDFDAATAAALAGIDVDEARQSLDELYNDHLVEEPVRGRYQFHDLVRDYVRGLAGTRPDPATDDAMTRLLNHYSAAADTANALLRGTPVRPADRLATRAEAAAWFGIEQPNLLATIDRAADRHGLAAARLSLSLRTYLSQYGHWNRAVALYETAHRAAAADPATSASVLLELGLFHRLLGDFDVAESYLFDALALHEELDDQVGRARVLGQLGALHRWNGMLETALGYATEALEIVRASNDTASLATRLSEVSGLQSRLGDHATARETALAALWACRASGNRANESNMLRTLAISELSGGLLDEAEVSAAQAFAVARETGYRIAQADAQCVLGVARQSKNRLDDACAAFAEALEIYTQIGERRGQADMLTRLGLLVCDRDPLSARRMHVVALRLARALSHAPLEARAWEGIGRTFVASGDIARAIPRLQRSVRLYGHSEDRDRQAVETLLTELDGNC